MNPEPYLPRLTARLTDGLLRLPEDFRDRHGDFLRKSQNPDGGFSGREGGSDLYYTGFALRSLAVLDGLSPELLDRTATYLRSCLAQQTSIVDFFSLLYSCLLVQAGGGADVLAEAPSDWPDRVAGALESYRTADGGYAKNAGAISGSTYHTFLVGLCYELLGRGLPRPEEVLRFVAGRRREDGGFVEIAPMKRSGTNPTAAAVGVLQLIGEPISDEVRAGVADFLAEMPSIEGGLRANGRVPLADLLSSFTGAWTLAQLGELERLNTDDLRDYADSLQRPFGGFVGGLWDDWTDVEYTFYGLGVLLLNHRNALVKTSGTSGSERMSSGPTTPDRGSELHHPPISRKGTYHGNRNVSKPHNRQRGSGQIPRLEPGEDGPEDRRRGTIDDRRFVSERGLSAEQECHLQRQGRFARESRFRSGCRDRLAWRRHGRRRSSQAADGRRTDRTSPRKLQGQRCRTDHGGGALHRSKNGASDPERWRPRFASERFPQSWLAACSMPTDVPGLAATVPMTHVEALNLERLPDHLVVLGGGYVGLEFAQAMRRFGSRVTIIQRGHQLLEREDPDVADALLELMKDEGVEVSLQAEVLAVSGRSGNAVSLRVRSGAAEKTLEASDILVAAGRTANTDRLDLSKTAVELDSRGYIRVNEKLQTSAADVWAMGDCAGSPQFTHVGFDDFRVVLSNLTGGSRTTRGRLIPYCLFTDPELAHVGLNETEARAQNVSYRVARLPMALVMRARALSQTRGFVKALIGSDDRILGFTAFGAEASEMMAVAQTAMIGGMPFTALRNAIFTHPTAAEGLVVLFSRPPSQP